MNVFEDFVNCRFGFTKSKLNTMKKLLLFSCLVYLIFPGEAQIYYEKRQEFELRDDYVREKLYEFGEMGFVMSSLRDEKTENNESEWKFELFNTDIESQKTDKVLLYKKYRYDETFRNEERLHILFKTRKGDYSIVSVNASDLGITQVEGTLPKKSWIREMAVLGDYAYFNGSIKRNTVLFSVNWKTGKHTYIPVQIEKYPAKKISLQSFQVLEESNEVFLYVKVYVKKKHSEMYIIRLNDKGEKEEIFNMSKNIDKNIIDVSASTIGEGKYIFTGTYSSKFTGISEGMFFCQAQKNRIDFIQFYKFLDLENFLSYLPERRQEKIEKKKKRKEKKGKDLVINYRIADHEVIVLDDGFILLGEAFYPTYRTETYTTTTTVNGVTTTTTQVQTVFDGYQYTHAVIAKFDKTGNLLWDEVFEMWPSYKPFYVKRFISISERDETGLKLVFSTRSRIISKHIDYNGNIIKERESDELETGFEGDKFGIFVYTFNVDYWYDKYFIAYGSQKIKNKEDPNVKKKRKVYFVNKVRFE